MIELLLVVAIVIACTVWSMRHRWRRQIPGGHKILARRYARGEIDHDEYLEKRGDIMGYQAVSQSRLYFPLACALERPSLPR